MNTNIFKVFRPLHPSLGLALLSLVLSGVAGADERLRLEAKVNGRKAHLVFDTGASHSVLFQRGATRLGLSFTNAPKDVELAPGEIPAGRTEQCELQLGRTKVRTSFAVVEIPQVLPIEFDGVVGWGPVADNIIRIDASQGTVTCLANIPGEAANWLRFKLKTNSATLRFEVSHGGIAVDTGSRSGAALAPDQWRDWNSIHTNQPMTVDAYYSPGVGLVVIKEGWTKKLSIGSLMITDVPVREADKDDVALGSTGYQMTLGLAALKRLDFIVDGEGGFAYLHAKETPPPAYEHNRLGAVFTPLDLQSEDLIAHVADGSPAWVAGIRNGDLLTHIGRLDVTKWRTDPAVMPLRRFWVRPPGSKLELTLKRNKEIFKTEVVLRQILPPQITAQQSEADRKVVADIRAKAEKGDASSQYELGQAFALGRHGLARNCVEAVKWYRKAAQQNHAKAQYELGGYYATGQGVATNYVEAAKWWRKAAQQNHAKAQFNLGYCYAKGQGVAANCVEAVKWYRKAAEQNHAKAQFNLGICYSGGQGVRTNYVEAVKCWRKAAEQNVAKAQFNLGYCYAKGRGVAKDEVEGYKWLSLAVGQGDGQAARAKNKLAAKMTPEQISEGIRRAQAFKPRGMPLAGGR